MKVSYKKFFKLLIDREYKKTQFADIAGISQNTMAKLGKDEYVSLESLVKICAALGCTLDDIVELVKE